MIKHVNDQAIARVSYKAPFVILNAVKNPYKAAGEGLTGRTHICPPPISLVKDSSLRSE
ncbi:MAG: hypothetical protein V4577_30530 [Bacteroidota bacterium]